MPNSAAGGESFADLLFGDVAEEDLERLSEPVRAALAAHGLKTLAVRREDPSVKLTDGAAFGLADTLVLEAVNEDRPFLLDSTLEELRERGVTPKLVAHPILGVERDASGKLVGEPSRASGSGKKARESYIHIHLPTLPQALAAELKAGLTRVYAHVREAVEDFGAMRKRLAYAIADLKANPPPDAKAMPTRPSPSSNGLRTTT